LIPRMPSEISLGLIIWRKPVVNNLMPTAQNISHLPIILINEEVYLLNNNSTPTDEVGKINIRNTIENIYIY
jgi:hypothetical protein